MTVAINGERLLARLETFATIGATLGGGVNRQALSAEDREARALLAQLATERGFSVFQDDICNLFISMDGADNGLPPLLIGSHLDSQPTGGRYDGALGTLTAFEALESLADSSIKPARPVEVVAWTNEEGSRYAPGCMGSRAFAAGEIPSDWVGLAAADDGTDFESERIATFTALAGQAQHRRLGFPVFAYIELHIEQGPSLEKEGIPVGIVTGIQGTRWYEIAMEGQTAHAGTTALQYRRDPLKALTSALGSLYSTIMPEDETARFTVGRIGVTPGSINAIPATASCTIDLRHPSTETLYNYERTIASVMEEAANEQGVHFTIRKTNDMAPAAFPPDLVDTLRKAAANAGLATKDMLSGAFHDALFMVAHAPAAMIFVPCRDGLSHNEAEFVAPEDVVTGAKMFMAGVEALLAETSVPF